MKNVTILGQMICSISLDGEVMSREKFRNLFKIRCHKRSYLNLIPLMKTFRLYETIKCKKCGKLIAQSEELIGIVKGERYE